MVPDEGIEPPTFGLQNRCSTAELIRLSWLRRRLFDRVFVTTTNWRRHEWPVLRAASKPIASSTYSSTMGFPGGGGYWLNPIDYQHVQTSNKLTQQRVRSSQHSRLCRS